MSSTKRECKLHTGIGQGFCLLHGLYCCPSCHQKTYPDCSVSNIDQAACQLKQELNTSAAKLHNALQSCKITKTTLHEQFDDAQQRCGEAIDHVTEFCEQLQSTIEKFRQQGIETIRALTANPTDTIKEQLQKSEELEDFLTELNEKLCIDDTCEEDMTRNVDQKSSGSMHVNLVNLNTHAMDIRDGLAQVEPIEWVCKDDNFSIFIHEDRSINEHLANQLNVLCDSIGKSPEGRSIISNSDLPVSPPHARWKVQTDQDNDLHSLYSATGDARDNCATESFTGITKEGNRAPESFGELTNGENRVKDSFREITQVGNRARDSFRDITTRGNRTPVSFREVTRIFHRGSCRIVRFAQSSAGLYILIASQTVLGPFQISKVDEIGRTLVTKNTKTRSYDMSVRGEEVFAAANDRTIRVYRLADLHFMRQIPTREICGNIVCTDHDLVVTFNIERKRNCVCRLSETGHVTRESSIKITRACGMTMTSDGDRILVSDRDAGRIIVLSADLKLITEVINRAIVRPRGLCLVDKSVFAVCNDSVIELDSHGRYKRTVLDYEDGIVDPYQLSYDAQSRKLAVSSNTQSRNIIVLVDSDLLVMKILMVMKMMIMVVVVVWWWWCGGEDADVYGMVMELTMMMIMMMIGDNGGDSFDAV